MRTNNRTNEAIVGEEARLSDLGALARAVRRRCDGDTLIVGTGADELAKRFRSSGKVTISSEEVSRTDPRALQEIAGRQRDSLLLFNVVDYEEEAAKGQLADAWSAVAPNGRMVLIEANDEALRSTEQRGWNERRLRRLAKELGRPRVITDQPFRWLLLEMRKGNGEMPNEAELNRFKAIAKLCRGQVLELGCGEGHLSKAILDRGLCVLGVDINEPKIQIARATYPEIQFEVSDILEVDTNRQRHDTIVLSEVLEHVAEGIGDAMLERAWDCAAPGGRLVVSVPNGDHVPHRNHVRYFTKKTLQTTLSRFGRPRTVTSQPFKWLLMHVEKST